ncbi:hypothetical protein CPB83DRAFT_908917 [Crepidotus variabilis]|uniref:DNA breaking-rejoining enzyme n=2 Tax=Crepidotus variabilis TaxID=179855 RepID=A0A9P6JML6_9AGAR|nr:hypothetical protein CPB83DRAFT_908917 [Crepidotus variabilis]
MSHFTPNMFQAHTIPRMTPLEENILPFHSSSQLNQSQTSSNPTSLTTMTPSIHLKSIFHRQAVQQLHYQNGTMRKESPRELQEQLPSAKRRKISPTQNPGPPRNRFDNPLQNGLLHDPARKRTKPAPYSPSLRPKPSHLRPHVPAKDRLLLWVPLHARNVLDQQGRPTNLTADDLDRVKDVLEGAWAESTKETYGSGLLVYHVFCDRKHLPEEQRAPVSQIVMASFIATIAGAYSGKSISNYVQGVRAWHILHGVEWKMKDDEIATMLKAADKATPSGARRPRRTPYTIDFIISIRNHLNLSDPLHAAVYACLTTTFYSAARLGEFTVPRLDAFDPDRHVKPSDVTTEVDRQGLKSTVFHLPTTKASPITGEDVSWSTQSGLTNPEVALAHHLQLNEPPPAGALFAYQYKGSHRPLTKPKMIQVLSNAAKAAGLDPRQGHGIRIGSTLEYLLRGVPFDVMKVKGRWASSAFEKYLTKHAQILAPYMQDKPEIHAAFVRITMPPLR